MSLDTCSKCNIPLMPGINQRHSDKARWCDKCWQNFWDRTHNTGEYGVVKMLKRAQRPVHISVRLNDISRGKEWITPEEEL